MIPQYYKLNVRQPALRAYLRSKEGTLAGFKRWWQERREPPYVPRGGWLLPVVYENIRVDKEQLSAQCLSHLMPQIEALENLGFRPVAFTSGMRQNIHPDTLDTGCCWLLHATGDYIASVLYMKRCIRPPTDGTGESTNLSISYWLRSGRIVKFTNRKSASLELPEVDAHSLLDAPPALLFSGLRTHIRRHYPRDATRKIETLEQLIARGSELSLRRFQMQMQRGWFVPMTPEEVAVAKAQCSPWPPDGQADPDLK